MKVVFVLRNLLEDYYCGFCGYGCRGGGKNGMDKIWLVDVVENGVVILIGVKVERFVFIDNEGKKKK